MEDADEEEGDEVVDLLIVALKAPLDDVGERRDEDEEEEEALLVSMNMFIL